MSVRRVGFMMPSVNVVLEDDIRSLVPSGFSAQVSRVQWRPEQTPEELIAVRRAAAEQIRDTRPAVVGFACSSETMVSDEETAEVLAGFADLLPMPVVAAGPALVESLRALGARRIGVLTPLAERQADHELRFLEAQGFQLVESEVLGIADSAVVGDIAPEAIASRVARWASSPIDAAVVLCATYRGVEAAAVLRSRIALPVLAINEVTIRSTLAAFPSESIGDAA